MASGDNAVSGGLLVVIGIIVALIAVYFFYQGNVDGGTDVNINAEAPANPTTPAAPDAAPAR